MTEYSPPNTFFCQTYGLFEIENMYKFIGKNGAHFKYLTAKLGVDYIWWQKETNRIEIWGPHQKLKFAKKVMEDKLKLFLYKLIADELTIKPKTILTREWKGLERCNAIEM